jgi:triacylglycerol esterase/lipase EstA (alpha/beta hydrolase family)
MTKVIVFLPGTLGSEIILGGNKIWPGSLGQFLTGFSDSDFNKLLDPSAVAGDIIRSFSIVPQYSAFVDFLGKCGFQEAGNPPTLYPCAYDWRKSNRDAAKTLDAKIQRVNRDHGGDAEITLIGHSMGGLVARYYLESGDFDASRTSGFNKVANLYTLATPHLGAPIAVIKALGQDKTAFLSGKQIQMLGSNPLFPSLYELFPRRDQPVIWDTNSNPLFQAVDLFGAKGQAAGLSAKNLQVADAFHKALSGQAPQQTRYFFFSGTQKKTSINLTATADSGGTVRIDKSERDDSGDGTVPIWSSKFGNYPSEYVGGEHSEIYKDFQLQQTLKQLLVVPGLGEPVETPPGVVVTVTQLVLRPGEVSQLDITLGQRTNRLSGHLGFEKAVLGPDESLQGYTAIGAEQEISYEGPSFDRLRIQFQAPQEPG